MAAIDDYLKKMNGPERAELQRIRELVHKTVKDPVEVISYGMPGFKYKGKYLMGFNAFKDHLSIFPTNGPVEAVKDRLGNYETSKGTIRFTLDSPLPDNLIIQILKIRVAAIEG